MNKVCFSVACAAVLFGVTSFAEGETVITNELTLVNKQAYSEAIEIAANTVLKVSVASGTGTISGLISGDGKICKVGAGALQLGKYNSATEILPSKDGNTFTGGVDVQEGIFSSDQVIENAWGSGKITVNCANGARLILRGTLPNDIESFGDSTEDRPLLQAGAQTYYDGNIVAHGNVYYTDINYASKPERKDAEVLQVGGTVTILGEGKGFYAAPCTRINFKNTVTADLVKGYWISMEGYDSYDSSPTHGNLGSIKFSSSNNAIKKLEIDQTRIICGHDDCFTNTVIEFTGEHMAEGVGYFDLAGYNLTTPGIGDLIAPTPTSVDCSGSVITNSGVKVKGVTFSGSQNENYVNVRFDGLVSATPKGGDKNCFHFAARRHLMSGTLGLNGSVVEWSAGVAFPNLTGLTSANGSNQDFASLPAGFFSKVTSVSISSSNVKLKPDLFTPGKVALALNSSGTGPFLKNLDGVSSTEWRVKSLTAKDAQKVDHAYPMGVYTHTDDQPLCKIQAGFTVLVEGGDSPQTPVSWQGGADDASVTSAANWADESGATMTAAPEMRLPLCWATFVKEGSTATRAEVGAPVEFYGVKFGNVDGAFTLAKTAETATVGVQNGGFVFTDPDAAEVPRTYTVETPVELLATSAQTWSVPTNNVFDLKGRLTGSAKVTIAGGGELRLADTTGHTGEMYIDRIDTFLCGTYGAEDSTQTFTYRPNYNKLTEPILFGSLVVSNATFNTPVTLASAGSLSNGTTENSTTWYQTAPMSTNVYRKNVSLSATAALNFATNSLTVFEGEFSMVKTFNIVCEGGSDKAKFPPVVEFRGPIRSDYTAADYGGRFDPGNGYGIHVIFKSNGSKLQGGYLRAYRNSVYDFRVDDVFGAYGVALFGTQGSFELNDTKQNFRLAICTEKQPTAGKLGDSSKKVVVTGEDGSVATFVNGALDEPDGTHVTDAGKDYSNNTTRNYIEGLQFAGGVTLELNAASDETLRLYNIGSTSTGDVHVAKGTLLFDGTSCWSAGKNVIVDGGALDLSSLGNATAGNVFSSRVALTVAEGATINIPEGRALKVGTAVYDGATLSAGTHTADDAPFITGGGSLKVAHGMMLILK